MAHKVREHRQGNDHKAKQEQPCRPKQPPRLFTLQQIHDCKQHVAHIDAEQGELRPQQRSRPGSKQHHLTARRDAVAAQFGALNQRADRIIQHRQGQLLHTAAEVEAAGAAQNGGQQRTESRGGTRVHEQAERSPHQTQEDEEAGNFNEICAEEAAPGDQPSEAVHHIEQKALLLIDVPIQHPPAEHGLADGEKAIGVVPVVERVERRRAGAQRDHRPRREQQISEHGKARTPVVPDPFHKHPPKR